MTITLERTAASAAGPAAHASATQRRGHATMSAARLASVDDAVSRRLLRMAERRRSRIVTWITLVTGCAASCAAVAFAQALVISR